MSELITDHEGDLIHFFNDMESFMVACSENIGEGWRTRARDVNGFSLYVGTPLKIGYDKDFNKVIWSDLPKSWILV